MIWLFQGIPNKLLDELSKLAEHINIQKSIVFQYTNNEHAEIKTKDKMSFTATPNKLDT